jgi:putative Mg2+ transporter-C (MgtC) family protein
MNILEVIIRLALSTVIGGLIGYEREFKNKTAGFRTHILVCVGAAVTSMIQVFAIYDSTNMIIKMPELQGILSADMGRMGAQVITGVGFLGAGAIIRDRGSVKGLTTAASLWVVACIGLAVGIGYYSLSILSALSVYTTLVLLKRFETKKFIRNAQVNIEIEYTGTKNSLEKLVKYFNEKHIKILNVEVTLPHRGRELNLNSTVFTVTIPANISIIDIREELYNSTDIVSVKVL